MVAGTLANFQHPTLKHNLTTLKALHHVAWLDDTLHIELQMPFVWTSAFDALKEQTSSELLRITGAKAIDWKLSHSIATLKRVKNQPGVNGVKNIIAVSSGKGGVGKSSTAVNLALALAAEGAKVGILDADIYGPSIPNMLGAENQRPTSPDGTHMAPIVAHGLATNSIGYWSRTITQWSGVARWPARRCCKCCRRQCGLTSIIWYWTCRRAPVISS